VPRRNVKAYRNPLFVSWKVGSTSEKYVTKKVASEETVVECVPGPNVEACQVHTSSFCRIFDESEFILRQDGCTGLLWYREVL
jgi:hypothetical protein